MDDFSLDDLMAELDAVQAEETKHKLSERNCVEILQRSLSRDKPPRKPRSDGLLSHS